MLLTQKQAYNIYHLQATQRGRFAYSPWEAAALVDRLVTVHDCEMTDAIVCVCRGSYNNAPLSKLYLELGGNITFDGRWSVSNSDCLVDWYKDLSSEYRKLMDPENKLSHL